MKSIKKLLALLVAVLMVAATAFTALAATEDVEVVAGEIVTVEFTYDPAYNLSGVISWEAADGVVESVDITYAESMNQTYDASVIGDNGVWVVPKDGEAAVGGKITVCVNVATSAEAKAGEQIKVTISGEYGDANKGQGDDTPIEESAVITVKELVPTPTGDNGAIVLWGTVMVLAAACIVVSRRRLFN